MKCPKCGYLGFESGDRCKHCGYEFSLVRVPSVEDGPALDLPLKAEHDDGRVDDLALPLFESDTGTLTELPRTATPRPPLSVRRTPEPSRTRPLVRTPRRPDRSSPALEFGELPAEASHARESRRGRSTPDPRVPAASPSWRRAAAAVLDHAILGGIDLVVIYFTLRIAALDSSDWTLLPLAPLLAFLVLLKFAYFCAFTAVGGQTIGKMALGIRVVAEGGEWIDGPRAVRRTAAGALSTLPVGLGFLPALIAADHLALHDRVAHTRVVTVANDPSA